jgi:D-alanine-D-alanine ligase
VVRDAGIPTSDFFTVECRQDAGSVFFDPPYFIKPVAEGTGKGISPASIVQGQDELADACEALLMKYRQPVLVESYLPGRELTIGILGTGKSAEALGTVEVHLLAQAEQGVYSYVNKEYCEALVQYRLVRADEDSVVGKAEKIALDAWKVLGCRDAGRVDMRCDRHGNPMFLEVNALAGIHPEHSDLPIICNQLGIPYQRLIQQIVDSAAKRIKQQVSDSS